MKRTFLLLFTMLSCLFFVSCGDEPEVTKKESQDNQQEQKQNDDQKPDDGGTTTDTPEEVKIENTLSLLFLFLVLRKCISQQVICSIRQVQERGSSLKINMM